MIVIPKYQTVFIDIAKVASSSIKRYLQKHNVENHRFGNKNLLHNEYKDHFSFAFVRNPWSRMVSIYTNKILSPHKLNAETGVDICFARYGKVFYPTMTFTDFVKTVIGLDQNNLDAHIQAQHPNIVDENDKISIGFLGRLENIEVDWASVCSASGMPYDPLLHINKINRQHYSTYYSTEIKDMVANYWHKDINLFGYQFKKES